MSVKNAYRSVFVQHDRKEKNIVLSTDSSGCLLFQQYKTLNSLKVNITSIYKVLESNADSVNGNVYSWNLTRNNNKNIYIKYDTTVSGGVVKDENTDNDTEEDEEIVEEEKSDTKVSLYAILVIILAMLVFIIFVIVISKLDKRKYE